MGCVVDVLVVGTVVGAMGCCGCWGDGMSWLLWDVTWLFVDVGVMGCRGCCGAPCLLV